jgi:predicted phage tail protein
MDEVEGIGASNIESWTTVFTGHALTYTVTSSLTPKSQYRFKVRAVSEYLKESPYSSIAVFYAASLPEQITFPSTIFTGIEKVSLTFTWNQPVIDSTTMIAIDSYNVYWDAGYLLSGDFELIAQINSYD